MVPVIRDLLALTLQAGLFLALIASAVAQGIPIPRGSAASAGLRDDLPQIHRMACAPVVSGLVEASFAQPLSEGECGETSPLRLTSVADVDLPSRPLVNCATATGFAELVIALRDAGHDIVSITTGPGYECRIRNRAAEGKLSEHGFANAIDISQLVLRDGTTVSVENDWPHLPESDLALSTEEKKASRAARAQSPAAQLLADVTAAACKQFTTVLTPDSNSAHHGHIHLDLGCHGRDCSYLLCE
ncbi:MAG: extensin family protein [Nitratireductor sp.]